MELLVDLLSFWDSVTKQSRATLQKRIRIILQCYARSCGTNKADTG
jgi:hypothetical protein